MPHFLRCNLWITGFREVFLTWRAVASEAHLPAIVICHGAFKNKMWPSLAEILVSLSIADLPWGFANAPIAAHCSRYFLFFDSCRASASDRVCKPGRREERRRIARTSQYLAPLDELPTSLDALVCPGLFTVQIKNRRPYCSSCPPDRA